MICLDTNVVIALLNDTSLKVRARFEAEKENGEIVAISVIVLFELWYGAAKSARRNVNLRLVDEFASGLGSVLALDAEDGREAGEIRAVLETRGTPIGSYDILIAAQARRRDALLVTANTREFRRVPGLRIADWSF